MDVLETRICKTCGLEKSITEFYRHARGKGGYRLSCKECSGPTYPRAVPQYVCDTCGEFFHRRGKAFRARKHKYCSDECKNNRNANRTEKACYLCGETKVLAEFFRDRRTKDQHTAACKVCMYAATRNYVRSHPEKVKAWRHLFYLKNRVRIAAKKHEKYLQNPEYFLQQGHESYVRHQEARRAYQRAYYVLHRDERRAYNQAYWMLHHLEIRASQRLWTIRHPDHPTLKTFRFKEWAARNPEAWRLCRIIWRRNHPEYTRRHNLRRRARIKNATIVDAFSHEEIAERDHWRCHICGKLVTRENWSIDHHFPLSQPGAMHGRQYVSLAHTWCNSKRREGLLPAQLRLLP